MEGETYSFQDQGKPVKLENQDQHMTGNLSISVSTSSHILFS